MQFIDVAVGVITKKNSVLIAQRSETLSHGGMWEFPGGKVEAKESPQQSLTRELQEELGIEVQDSRLLDKIKHSYDKFGVVLWVYQVESYKGLPKVCEQQQQLLWVKFQDLSNYDFPAANHSIIQKLKEINTKSSTAAKRIIVRKTASNSA